MKKAFTMTEIIVIISVLFILEYNLSYTITFIKQVKAYHISNIILYKLKKEFYFSDQFLIKSENNKIIIGDREYFLDGFQINIIERSYERVLNKGFTLVVQDNNRKYYKIVVSNTNSIGFAKVRMEKIYD